MASSRRKRVGLALGGGAVRGLAHLGVLAVLEREGIPIDCIAGTSVGALVGATYCAGLAVETIQDLSAQVGWRSFVSPVWPTQGFVSFAKMERWLKALLGDLDFADLALPLAVAATDMESGAAVVLRQGRLAPAVRASCSIPGVVAPVKMNGQLLGDGFASDNLPVAAVRALGADYVIAVNICRPTIRRRWGPLGVGFAALENMAQRSGNGLDSADCLVSPDLCGFSYVRFSQRTELIARGAQAMAEKLPLIRAALADQ